MKKQLPQVVLIIFLIGMLSGFNHIKPRTEIPSLFVHHQIKGETVLINCVVSGISFRETDHSKKNLGKLVIWIDGKKKSEVKAAAFIIKGLSPGSHRVKLEVVDLNNQPYGMEKEFMVNITR
ncbi:hypothetical protein M3610_01990 [Neobacillus sp. MER 74]|uniref:hypothetical protein n=1 Tax=Neobacillus sp. MER 74 TaxID=2939566 RepID=UPI0020408488|nr:hypothetical protein [Neobacillus sp. MER 74]MCM3114059.1 hypothetical protein [Neobacillus sp. MER 74]